MRELQGSSFKTEEGSWLEWSRLLEKEKVFEQLRLSDITLICKGNIVICVCVCVCVYVYVCVCVCVIQRHKRNK